MDNRPNQQIFTFKDSHRYQWRVAAWESGETTNGDLTWAYTIEREDGGNMIEVYHGEITGQGDEDVKLRQILYDYLCYVALAMMDGTRSAM